MASSDYQIVQSDTFQGGLVTLQPAHLLSDGATPSCSNIDFSTSLGRLTKRKGHSLLQNANLGSGHPLTGLYEYIKADGTTVLYEAVDGGINELTPPSTRTVRFHGNISATYTVTSFYLVAGWIVANPGTSDVWFGLSNAESANLSTGDYVYITGLTGADYTPYNGRVYQIAFKGTSAGEGIWYLDHLTSALNVSAVQSGSVSKLSAITLGAVNFTTFNNLCIAVSPTMTTVKSTGGVFTALLGSPPANASYIETHKGRVFIANTSAGKSRCHFSFLNNPEDWTTSAGLSTDAGYIDVGLDDGETITGIKSIGSVLLVFKQTSTWAVFGTNPTDFKVRKISPSIGCIAPRSIVACDTFAIFLSNLGIYSANSEGCTMLSYNIKPTVDLFTSAARLIAAGGRLNTQYWLAVDTDADSINDTVYYLDYVYGVWGLYTNKKDSVYYSRRNGTLISGGMDTDVVRTQNDTDNDNGSAITMVWDTPDFDFEDWTRVKHPTDILVVAYPISGKTIVISHLIDGVSQGTTLTFTLTATGAQDKVYLTKRGLPNTSFSRYIRFRFTNSETSAPVQIFAYSIRAFLDQRQNG